VKISFIIPSFNQAAWLPHAVKSCQDQTYKNIEIVIVNDCSTDSTPIYLKWLKEQNDKRIKIVNNDKNMGRSESRNMGNRLATGGIICVNDADDLSSNTRAELTMKKMKNCQVCYGSAVVMDALGNGLREIIAGPIDKENCLKTKLNGIVHSSMAYSKELAIKYPYKSGKPADLGIDDWMLQTEMLMDNIKFDFISDIVCAYRIHSNSITKTRNEEEVLEAKIEILNGFKIIA
jgi:glycosyltransferase involved in cell wall biosynthesis